MNIIKLLLLISFLFIHVPVFSNSLEILETIYNTGLLTSTKKIVFEQGFNITDEALLYFIAEDIHENIMPLDIDSYKKEVISYRTLEILYMFMYVNHYMTGAEYVYEFLSSIDEYEQLQYEKWMYYLQQRAPYVSEQEETLVIPELIRVMIEKKNALIKKYPTMLIRAAHISRKIPASCEDRKKIHAALKKELQNLCVSAKKENE